MSGCEHGVCGALVLSREGPSWGAVPSWHDRAPWSTAGSLGTAAELIPGRRAAGPLQAVFTPMSTPHQHCRPAPAHPAELTQPRQQPLPCAWQWGGTDGHRGCLPAASAPSQDRFPPMEAPN